MSKKWNEETLDPENWEEMKALGHRMLDDMITRLQTIRDHHFSWASEEEIKNILTPLTSEGEGEEKVYEIFRDNKLNNSMINVKPCFWGAVVGTGSIYGMLADMLTSGVNLPLEGAPWIPGYTHRQVIDWIKEMLEYPHEAGGVLVGGGSEANFTGLAVARNAKAKKDMKTKGIYKQPEKMTLYCSEETHHCTERSVELLGFGNEALRWLPTDKKCKINTSSLIKTINKDRANGLHPLCIIGNAGTVNSGAFDDFITLRNIADKQDMWLHIDGAYGAWIKLSETHRHLANGIELADSLAVDLHKWMYMPYGIGCTLIKNKLAHYKTFVYGHAAEYIQSARDLSDDELSNPHMLSLQLSRNNSSLKAYMLLRAHGKNKYCRLIQQNIDQIEYLASLIEKEPNIEFMAPVISNVVCFRYNPSGLDDEQLEKLNKMILQELFKINFWIISDTTIKGKYMLRACNVNHRSRREDFDFLIEEIKKIGKKVIKSI
ncbi:MAG: pyridoxal phosphate-dependent decarboxylase family protein [Promethearchaeota archaeon]|jgi:glutamate/tyrosine decarboxylase-like PLP-dependent enzyme